MRSIESIAVPDSKLSEGLTELARDTQSELLFSHSSRVYCFGGLSGLHRGLPFDRALPQGGAIFHDLGSRLSIAAKPSASKSIAQTQRATCLKPTIFGRLPSMLSAIALRTTLGIPVHMHPVIAGQ
jgi:hypothetical protein